MSESDGNATAKAVIVDPHVIRPKYVWIDVSFRYVNGGIDVKFEEGNSVI